MSQYVDCCSSFPHIKFNLLTIIGLPIVKRLESESYSVNYLRQLILGQIARNDHR